MGDIDSVIFHFRRGGAAMKKQKNLGTKLKEIQKGERFGIVPCPSP